MAFKDIIKKTRTYRKFDSTYKISKNDLIDLIDNAHFSASYGNTQTLRYLIYNDEQNNAKIFSSLKWAASLPNWDGPIPSERPTAFIIILSKNINNYTFCDAGISMQTIMLSATEKKLGGCIFASIDKEKLQKDLGIDDVYKILYVIALGKPIEKVQLEVASQSLKYWRDEKEIHHVPKIPTKNLILNIGKE